MEIVAYQAQGTLAALRFVNKIYTDTGSGTLVDGFTDVCEFRTDLPQRGEPVYAIGNGVAYGVAISDGIVSAPNFSAYREEYGYDMIQTDCPINGGNSGGRCWMKTAASSASIRWAWEANTKTSTGRSRRLMLKLFWKPSCKTAKETASYSFEENFYDI